MPHHRFTFLLFVVHLGLAFLLTSCGGKDDPPEKAKVYDSNYPLNFSGYAKVTTPGTTDCVVDGYANFTLATDGACAYYVTFPMTIVNEKGECALTSDTEAWLLTGTFDKETQVCNFIGCNDHPDYTASGGISYDLYSTAPTTISCSLVHPGKLQTSIEAFQMKPPPPP